MTNEKINQSWIMAMPASVFYDSRLKPIDREAFLLCSALQRATGVIYASNQYIATCLNVSISTAKRAVRALNKAGYLKVDIEPLPGGGSKREMRARFDKQCPKVYLRNINIAEGEPQNRGVTDELSGGVTGELSEGSLMTPNTYSKRYTYSKKNKEKNIIVELGKLDDVPDKILGDEPPVKETSLTKASDGEHGFNVKTLNNIQSVDDFAKEILVLTNEILGRNFKPVPSTLKYIQARIKEGKKSGVPFSIDDVEKMVRSKKSEWQHTDQKKYLRIETLFNGKFWTYLEQAENQPKPKPKVSDARTEVTAAMLDEFVAKTGLTYQDYNLSLTHEENLNA